MHPSTRLLGLGLGVLAAVNPPTTLSWNGWDEALVAIVFVVGLLLIGFWIKPPSERPPA